MIIFQPDRHLLKKFIAKNAPNISGTILDAGGGNRRYAHLFSHCKEYKTMDINPNDHPDIVGNLEDIPLNKECVDGIICTQVLGDIWNIEKAIAEMARVLKKDGVLLLTESLFNEEHDEPLDYRRLTQFAWKKMLNKHFSNISIEQRGGFFSQIAQQKIRYRIEKHHLYQRPILGRVAHIISTAYGKIALYKDSRDTSSANKKFPIGYNIIAIK